MKTIKIKTIKELKEAIKGLDEDCIKFLIDDKSFVAVSNEGYDLICMVEELMEDEEKNNDMVKVVTNNANLNDELSFDQYESLKKQVVDALDKALKPHIEKLN